MTIYYEDNDIIVCEKPYGVSSQISNGENMVKMLENHTQGEVFPINRLDVTTTGVMVYAKNKSSASNLCTQVAERTFDKEYMCVCYGKLSENGEMNDFLYHDKMRNKSFVKKSATGGTKEAKLEFCRVGTLKMQSGEELSLAKIKLYTGRTHQIRVQFSSRGFVLYGDGKYGAKDNGKTALHCSKISFLHPKTNEKLEFLSNPSGEIWNLFHS